MSSPCRSTVVRLLPRLFVAPLILLAACGSDPVAPPPAAPAWEWLNPTVAGGEVLKDVWAASPTDVMAVGTHGTIVHFDGARCGSLDSGVDADLTGIWSVGAGEYVVIGADATVLRGGVQGWRRIPVTEPVHLRDVWADGPDGVYILANAALSASGTSTGPDVLLHLVADGWETIPLPLEARGCACIFGFGPDDIRCGFAASMMYRFDGSDWSPYSMAVPGEAWSPGIYALSGLPGGDLYAVGYGGTVRHGEAQAELLPDLVGSMVLWDVWAADSTTIWVAGSSTGGLAARFDGRIWHRQNGVTETALSAIHGPSPDLAFAVGSDGAFLRNGDGRWSPVNGFSARQLTTVWGSSSDDMYVGGDDGLYHGDGAGFVRVAPELGQVSQVWGTAPDDVHAVGVSYTPGGSGIVHFDGAAWRNEPVGDPRPGFPFVGGCGGGDADLLVAAPDGILRRGPTGWLPMTLPELPGSLAAIGALSDSQALAVGYRGTVVLGEAGTWTLEDGGTDDDLTRLWVADPHHAFAGTRQGQVLVRTDGSWRAVGDFGPSAVTALWGRSATEVFAAAGGLIHRYDGGAWAAVADPPGGAPQAAWADGAGAVTIVGSGGLVLRARADELE